MGRWGGQIAPATHGVAVTPSDSASNNFDASTQGVYVGTTGNVAVVFEGQTSAVTFTGVPAGTVLDIRIDRVNATGTTASNLVALFTRS